jgi:twinkle protein
MNREKTAAERGAVFLDSEMRSKGRIIADDLTLDKFEKSEESSFVKPAASWADELIEHIHGTKPAIGFGMGWPKTREFIEFKPAEVTEWFGYNGHGKSAFTTQLALNFMEQYVPVCIASFEMRPVSTLDRMSRMAYGRKNPPPEFLRDFCEWTDNKFWIYDVHGQVRADRVIACGRYVAGLGVKHFFIDSLMKCIKDQDDYNGEKNFVDRLGSLGKETGMHIHLVHHAKKGDENNLPRKDDSKGSGAIIDQVDNQIAVWMNKAKFDKQEQGIPVDESDPDVIVKCYSSATATTNPSFYSGWTDLQCSTSRSAGNLRGDISHDRPNRHCPIRCFRCLALPGQAPWSASICLHLRITGATLLVLRHLHR